jgi:hypothetical protein
MLLGFKTVQGTSSFLGTQMGNRSLVALSAASPSAIAAVTASFSCARIAMSCSRRGRRCKVSRSGWLQEPPQFSRRYRKNDAFSCSGNATPSPFTAAPLFTLAHAARFAWSVLAAAEVCGHCHRSHSHPRFSVAGMLAPSCPEMSFSWHRGRSLQREAALCGRAHA